MQSGFSNLFRASIILLLASSAAAAGAPTCQDLVKQMDEVVGRLQTAGRSMAEATNTYGATQDVSRKCVLLDEAASHGQAMNLAASNLSSPCYALSQQCLNDMPDTYKSTCKQLGSLQKYTVDQLAEIRSEKVRTCQ